MKLHSDVENLKIEIDVLKAENEMLKPLAEEAQYLADVLKVFISFLSHTNKVTMH